jgi:hypothetical protein
VRLGDRRDHVTTSQVQASSQYVTTDQTRLTCQALLIVDLVVT